MGWLGAFILGGPIAASAAIQRDAIRDQQRAMEEARAEDARKAAEAETSAQVAANAQLVDKNRRRRNSALALGDPSGGTADTLGGPATALAGGAGPAARAVSSPSASRTAGTALGAGYAAPLTAGRVTAGGGRASRPL